MTKKLICPNCKQELEFVKEHTKEYRTNWIEIHKTYKRLTITDDECDDSTILDVECPECYYQMSTAEDFVVDDDT